MSDKQIQQEVDNASRVSSPLGFMAASKCPSAFFILQVLLNFLNQQTYLEDFGRGFMPFEFEIKTLMVTHL